MINLSSIKMHMYCPMSLYLKTHVDIDENDMYNCYLEIKNLKIDIQDLMQKNIRKIKRTMSLEEIEKILSQNIYEYIENTTKSMKSSNIEITSEQISEINDETYFNIKILSIKSKKAMTILNKDGFGITEMFFPNCLYSYLIKDTQLELIGICDKIEIIDGRYYPISIKSSNPPIKGVWDQDAIELVANAILLEEEFDTEIFVGFVDYKKIGDRRPVIMDVNLRKSLFSVIREVKEIIENKKLPNIKRNSKKCRNCEYENICMKK
ncbi:CRISPR-associated exonuclease, Cas4 family [Methanobrevibacter gottschalkii]|uniref:CRISPR-associated exonuclease Cas4 n=2 Tax=Methanobrevibacter gottschalkii TaxID=190974 RepID=A0A3N5BB31_9EURY|nr:MULTISPECIES: CRISPR-associated protein Cas4 [Methanobrevibacter]MCQ2970178.1 CRISPR-associated protein Cas4 [archaeon]OEC93823.1 CRISPR-associated protein Cas4 [Methanobrevibacter sp. A27]RPF52660.1 CRISPR-associated Cas4 family exonuclease [Methanobrevibacter gottschalkii DSM 11977]SEK28906.1 CRISPR-associated exonuclease, Cas4 family [Methanobrevibacter gottschalkii]